MNSMNRSKLYSWTIFFAVLLLVAWPKTIIAAEYDIIADGKLTSHGAIVGRSTRAGDGKDDKAFILNGLYKFVYAGAGFRSSDARIHARLSINKLGSTGAGILVNGHWFTFDIAPGNKIGVAGPAFGKNAKPFAEAEGRIKPGVPFDVEILIKDGLMTYSINGEKVGESKDFPTAMETVPSADVGSVHKLGVITALRSWRADLKIYEFKVETDGEIVPLPEMQTIYQSGSATTHTYRIPALLESKQGTLLAFASKLPMGGWARQADWGPCHPDVTLDDHPDGITANWAKEKLLEAELQEPFFLGAGIFQPHLPNYAPREYFDRFPIEEIKLPEGFREDDLDDVPAAHAKMAHNSWLKRIRATDQWKPAILAYLACTAMVDDLIGQVVEALEKSDYADNTIIVLWSDHGFQLGEKGRWAKYSLWERATRVNLMWVVPHVTTPGTTSSKPVNLLDIYPTLASLTGCEPPEGQLEGNDLTALMKNQEAD